MDWRCDHLDFMGSPMVRDRSSHGPQHGEDTGRLNEQEERKRFSRRPLNNFWNRTMGEACQGARLMRCMDGRAHSDRGNER